MKKCYKVVGMVLMVFLLIGTAFTLFASTKEKEATEPEEGMAEPIVVGLAWNEKNANLIVAWEDYMVDYSKEYGQKIGREFKWIINVADGDPSRQNANIEDLITQQVDVIITRPQDKVTIGPAIKAAKEAGIPVICFDRESEVEKPNAFVGQDGVALAYDTSSSFAKLLKEKGVEGKAIELVGDLRDQNALNFQKGWAKAEQEFGAWETLVTVPTEWNPEKYKSGLINALQAHPEANVVWIPSDFAMDAVRSALEEAGRWIPRDEPGHLWMASIGAMPAALPALEGGYLDIAGVWDAWFVSRKAVEVVAMLAGGEKMDNKQFLVSGRPATPDNFKTLENFWSLEYE